MTIDPNTLDLSELLKGITLDGGLHDEAIALAEHRMCVMEAAGWIAGEPWSDHPACVSPSLGAFARAWNDALARHCPDLLPDLKAYIPRLIGTAGDLEAERRRAWIAADFAVRVAAPAYLRYASLTEQADHLASLPVVTIENWSEARAACQKTRSAAAASAASAAAAAAAYVYADAAAAASASAKVLRELHPRMCEVFERMIEAPSTPTPTAGEV